MGLEPLFRQRYQNKTKLHKNFGPVCGIPEENRFEFESPYFLMLPTKF